MAQFEPEKNNMSRTGNQIKEMQLEIDALQAQVNRLVKRTTKRDLRIHKIEQWITEHLEVHSS